MATRSVALSPGVPRLLTRRMYAVAYQLPEKNRKGRVVQEQEIRPLLWLDRLFIQLSRGLTPKDRNRFRKRIRDAGQAALQAGADPGFWAVQCMFLRTLLLCEEFGVRKFAPKEEQELISRISGILKRWMEGKEASKRVRNAAYAALGRAVLACSSSPTLAIAVSCFKPDTHQAVQHIIRLVRARDPEGFPKLKPLLLHHLLLHLEGFAEQQAKRGRRKRTAGR